MAVTSIREGWNGVEAGGDDRQRRLTRVFTIRTDSAADGPLFSYPLTSGAVTIPARGTAHASSGYYLSGEPHVTCKGPTHWECRVEYKTQSYTSFVPPTADDPLDEPALVSWSTFEESLPYHRDLDGTAVVNAAGKPFDPAPTRTIKQPLLTIERNQAAFDPDDLLLYVDTVCSAIFWGAAIGRARMMDMQARSVAAATPYFRVSYQIAFRMKTPTGVTDANAWAKEILNQGFGYLATAGDLTSYVDTSPEPCLLAANGTLITAPASATYLYFREFFGQSWAALALE